MGDLKVVAVGDSVMWGQGLRHEEKFVSLVYARLTGGSWPVEDLLARSGSIIGVGRGGDPIPEELVDDREARHEVPWDSPTILGQVEGVAEAETRGTGLVILGGGINDVGVNTILGETLAEDERSLETHISTYCYNDLIHLLRRTRERFPDARIVVLGYYPILSPRSDFDLVRVMMVLFGFLGVLLDIAVKKAIRNALYFHYRQLRWIRSAVADANRDRALRGPGILFVHPAFGAENSVAAGNPFLFQPLRPASVTLWIQRVRAAIAADDPALLLTVLAEVEPQAVDHPVARKRRRACDAVYPGDMMKRMRCRIAALGHPNERGAIRYADAILERLEGHRATSVRDHVGRLSDRAGPVSVREALKGYGLRPEEGLRACIDLMTVDCIEVEIVTRNEELAGTNDRVFFQVADGRRWLLNYGIFDLEFMDDFEPGSTGTYTIDPMLDGGGGPLHLGDIREITLIKERGLPGGDWRPESIVVRVNGLEVHQAAIDAELTNGEPKWTATDPAYPKRL